MPGTRLCLDYVSVEVPALQTIPANVGNGNVILIELIILVQFQSDVGILELTLDIALFAQSSVAIIANHG